MKEGRIEIFGTSASEQNETDALKKSFITKDFLTDKDIEDTAKSLAEAIVKKISETKEDGEKVEVLVDMLSGYGLLNSPDLFKGSDFIRVSQFNANYAILSWKDKNGVLQEDRITVKELEPFLQKIRKAVLGKLSAFLPREIIARASKGSLNTNGELEEGRYFKPLGSKGVYAEIESQVSALKHLHELPERSPFIYYGTETLDPRTGATVGKALQLSDMTSELKEFIKPKLNKILGFLIDIVEGHIFLTRNGLTLIDNHLDNLGIDKEKGTGVLFDLGGLRKLGTPIDTYIAKREYLPPEYRNGTAATIENIVWELGLSLEKITQYYPRKSSFYAVDSKTPQQLEAIHDLAIKMMAKNPEKRPTLEEVKNRLKDIKDIGN